MLLLFGHVMLLCGTLLFYLLSEGSVLLSDQHAPWSVPPAFPFTHICCSSDTNSGGTSELHKTVPLFAIKGPSRRERFFAKTHMYCTVLADHPHRSLKRSAWKCTFLEMGLRVEKSENATHLFMWTLNLHCFCPCGRPLRISHGGRCRESHDSRPERAVWMGLPLKRNGKDSIFFQLTFITDHLNCRTNMLSHLTKL